MLYDIKSKYLIEIVFSALNAKIKLELSGRYILNEINGQKKEYNAYNDNLVFIGEYLYGKRNGKGKEYYDNGNILFEGEYLNGVKNGKGKEYNYNGTLKFEGKYFNGEMIKNIHI